MCYILYGAINKEVNRDDYDSILRKFSYKFSIGTKHDVKMCIVNDSYEYRVTKWVCDCDFPVGKKDIDAKELVELASMINELKNARDSEYIYISKTWSGKKYKTEKSVSVNETEMVSFLANMDLDCLYRMEFQK